ncbi:MAG: efflux RND transporter periplasmic adaptor subunit [Fuerstiella sp.]
MKPIRHNPVAGAAAASLPDDFGTLRSGRSALASAAGSVSSARFEDIVGVGPVSVSETRVSEEGVHPRFWPTLQESVRRADTMDDALTAAARTLQSEFPETRCGWFAAGDGESAGRVTVANPAVAGPLSPELETQVAEFSQQSLRLHQTVHVPALPSGGEGLFLAVTDGHGLWVCRPTGRLRSSIRGAAEATCAVVAGTMARQHGRQAEQEARHVAALLELLQRMSAHDRLQPALKCLVDELQRYLQADTVLIGICRDHRPENRLMAVSGSEEVDRLAASTSAAEAVCQEALTRGSLSVWPAMDSADRHGLLCHRQFADEAEAEADCVVSSPLRTDTNQPVGCLVVTFQQQTSDNTAAAPADIEESIRFLHAAAHPVAAAVHSVQRATRNPIGRLVQSLRRFCTTHIFGTVLTVIAVCSGLLLIPVDYKVSCDTELQPVARRFVAAPFAAPLKECLVEPGDVVEAGQLLALLDGRELRWELAGVRADLGKATREYDAFLSEQKFGETAIARHEIERLQNRAALLTDRTRSLEVRSPIAGIVVAGDLKDSEGVPLESGQSLFEVAPLDRMVVELAVPEDDVRHVDEGLQVTLTLDSMPSESFRTTVVRVHPRAELRQHQNVFIADAELDNPERELRPGMRGSARISTGVHSLGWNLFHKPVAHVRGWLGW